MPKCNQEWRFLLRPMTVNTQLLFGEIKFLVDSYLVLRKTCLISFQSNQLHTKDALCNRKPSERVTTEIVFLDHTVLSQIMTMPVGLCTFLRLCASEIKYVDGRNWVNLGENAWSPQKALGFFHAIVHKDRLKIYFQRAHQSNNCRNRKKSSRIIVLVPSLGLNSDPHLLRKLVSLSQSVWNIFFKRGYLLAAVYCVQMSN